MPETIFNITGRWGKTSSTERETFQSQDTESCVLNVVSLQKTKTGAVWAALLFSLWFTNSCSWVTLSRPLDLPIDFVSCFCSFASQPSSTPNPVFSTHNNAEAQQYEFSPLFLFYCNDRVFRGRVTRFLIWLFLALPVCFPFWCSRSFIATIRPDEITKQGFINVLRFQDNTGWTDLSREVNQG